MYLHIGYNSVSDLDKVIGIFSSESLLKSEQKSSVYEESKTNLEKYKSIILYEDGSLGFSKIGAGNLLKRYRKELKK